MTWPGIELQSPRPLANTLLIRPMAHIVNNYNFSKLFFAIFLMGVKIKYSCIWFYIVLIWFILETLKILFLFIWFEEYLFLFLIELLHHFFMICLHCIKISLEIWSVWYPLRSCLVNLSYLFQWIHYAV